MFENFYGNHDVAAALERMMETDRIAQTILLAGPEGVGKSTLVRRFAARLLGSPEKIEHDDLSREENAKLIAEREKWPSEKRAEDPLFFSTHPDFVTVCPEGPLRQISIQQMRLLRERAQLLPLKGKFRVFLIDQFHRASGQAADSLLKTLEEPPPHLVLFLTAENAFDLPATIRSRSIHFHLSPLSDDAMRAFLETRGVAAPERRMALAAGSPGLAAVMDLGVFEKRRALLMTMLEAAAGANGFAAWAKASESMLASKTEKLDLYLKPLYSLLEDLLVLANGSEEQARRVRNADLRPALERLARQLSFEWLREATAQVDDLAGLQRRNVQKGLTLDRFVVTLRGLAG
jgi:DNA polymerase-3 subunit delta'